MVKKGIFAAIVLIIATLALMPFVPQSNFDARKFRAISEEAFIYAFPMIMAYDIIYQYGIDKNSSQYKGPFNQIFNDSKVFTPKDTAVVTPNSDTPYSFLMMDLRTEPLVLCMPEIKKERYYSIQLISLYTFNFGYIGSRTTGNGPGCYAVAGPHWNGEIPQGIKKIFRSETDFAIAIYRTQLFNPGDIENVQKIQSGYKVQTLSQFLNKPEPPPAPPIKWPKINKGLASDDPLSYLNFLLQFAPPIGTAAVEKPLREQFEKIGVVAGKPFPLEQMDIEQKGLLDIAIVEGLDQIERQAKELGQDEHGWRVATSGFGNRTALNGNWTLRAAAAKAGIFGNDAVEAMYPMARDDENGEPLDGSQHRYTLTFPQGQLPPVHAFWSVTMYDGKTQLLIENPINRYLINSPMLPDLKKNPDGSLTLYIQKESPGKDLESNWLPAPNGPIYIVMRLYWPKDEALKGVWQPPGIKKVN